MNELRRVQMELELEQSIQAKETKPESAQEQKCTASLQQDAFQTKSLAYFPGPVNGQWNLPGVDVITQEGMILGQILDSGNTQLAAARLQADLYQLRPNRYAQNLLLNNVNLYDRKGLGSDLSLGYYNPYTAAFSHGYIIPSVYRPYPTIPLSY